jgi:hypothetical protein
MVIPSDAAAAAAARHQIKVLGALRVTAEVLDRY